MQIVLPQVALCKIRKCFTGVVALCKIRKCFTGVVALRKIGKCFTGAVALRKIRKCFTGVVALCKIRKCFTGEKAKLLAKSFINSQFSYGTLVWMFLGKTSVAKICKIYF